MPSARTAALTCAALALALTSAPSPASAAGEALSRTTSVGVHNAYETATFPHFADALDSGAGLLELDVWTDEEQASRLRDLAAEGRLDEAATFPAVLGARGGDPRERYAEELRPWFVVFDGSAPTYTGGIDTSWYGENDYLLVMTDAHAVSPAIDARTPSPEEAAARVRELAQAGATTVTSDWAGLPGVLSMVVPHGPGVG